MLIPALRKASQHGEVLVAICAHHLSIHLRPGAVLLESLAAIRYKIYEKSLYTGFTPTAYVIGLKLINNGSNSPELNNNQNVDRQFAKHIHKITKSLMKKEVYYSLCYTCSNCMCF